MSDALTHYRCKDCGYEFYDEKDNIEGCPNCSSTLVDDLAFLAGGWMLGDWFGLWGDDD